MINEETLHKYNAELVDIVGHEYIFQQNDTPNYYYQIVSGSVKMNYYSSKGNEFIQGIFGRKMSFGEPPLLAGLTYPANAKTLQNTQLLRLPKTVFFDLLKDHPEIHLNITQTLSKRLYYKAVIANGISSKSAEEAILSLFDYLKHEVYLNQEPLSCSINLTRKNIAGLTGLTIETTIRKIKELESIGKVRLDKNKIFY